MSEENTETSATGTEGTETVETLTAKVEHWKSMARKNEDRAKENATAAEKLAALENAGKTEAEKAAERIASAEAAAAGVPAKVAESLRDALVTLGVVSEADKVLLTASDSDTLLAQVKRLTDRASASKESTGNRAPLQGRSATKSDDDNPLRGLARGLFKSDAN